MKIAFLSRYGDAADIALRMTMDGHDVRLYIDDPKFKGNWEGLVKKCATWQQAVQGVSLAVFDDNKLPHIWRAIHKSIPCFGGSEFAAKLEDDRKFAHSLMKQYGITEIESRTFKTHQEVIKHLKEHKVAHVVKPTGDKVESHHVIVGEDEDNSDSIALTERLGTMGIPFDSYEVEEKKKGVESALSGWFNGTDWVGPINANWEHKKLHERETGPLCGEAGTLMRYIEDPENPLFLDTLNRIKPALVAGNFRGQIDINMIVNEEGHFPLEFTPRLGKPSVFIEDELHVTEWADLFYGIAAGQKTDLQVRYDWAVGVVLFGFGFPHEDKASKISQGLPIKGLSEHTLDHIHPMQVRLNKKGLFEVGYGEGYIAVATGRGASTFDAKQAAYGHLSGLRVQNSHHRFDISDKIDRYELESLGILPIEEGNRA